jgi:hypothetical protein
LTLEVCDSPAVQVAASVHVDPLMQLVPTLQKRARVHAVTAIRRAELPACISVGDSTAGGRVRWAQSINIHNIHMCAYVCFKCRPNRCETLQIGTQNTSMWWVIIVGCSMNLQGLERGVK